MTKLDADFELQADQDYAFPWVVPSTPEYQGGMCTGMTLRDYWEGQALAGLMANANMPFSHDYAECEPRQIAEACRAIADALLAQREEKL